MLFPISEDLYNFDIFPKVFVKGKEAEIGCVGCPWYDIQKWRENLISTLKKGKKDE